MDRRDFIRRSCVACSGMGLALIGGFSCVGDRYITGTIEKDGISINKREFRLPQNRGFRDYIIVRHPSLQFPICVYRRKESEYSALWMQCTHQGAMVQVAGERLQCTAHGSEFDSHGEVKAGPAITPLRRFPVKELADHLFIDLRAI